jgi:hypothetical protein
VCVAELTLQHQLENSLFRTIFIAFTDVVLTVDDVKQQKSCNNDDYWFQQFWQEHVGCNSSATCQLVTSLGEAEVTFDYNWGISTRAYDATYVYAEALHRTIAQKCPDVFEAPQKTSSRVRDCVRGEELLKNLLVRGFKTLYSTRFRSKSIL